MQIDRPLSLSDLQEPVLRITCAKCGLARQIDVDRHLTLFGDVKLSNLLWRLTAGCSRKSSVEDPCAAAVSDGPGR